MRNWLQRRSNLQSGPWKRLIGGGLVALLALLAFWLAPWPAPELEDPSDPAGSDPVQVSTGTIGPGGSLLRSLESVGLGPAETVPIERALRPLFNPRRARPEHQYEIHRSSDGQFIRLLYWPNRFEYFTVEASTGPYRASQEAIPLTESTVGVAGQIRASLWEAMVQQEVPPEMIYRFADLFSARIDFLTEPRVGDSYKLIWKRRSGNGAVRDRQIVAAWYQGKLTGEVSAFPFDGEYFDDKGDSLRGIFLRAPLAFRRISSRFTNRRLHPVLRYYRPHHGIDYAAARGTPIVSIGEGVVIAKGWAGGLGNAVRIRHSGGYVSIYGHMMGFARGLRVGQSVRQGQVIGYVGATGLATGPHLHFAFQRGGQLVNFLGIRPQNIRQSVPKAQRPAFRQVKSALQGMLERLPPASEKLVLVEGSPPAAAD